MPPVEEPIRERIAAAIAQRLRAITAGADYWTTPALVTRSLLPIDQYASELTTGPVLGIVRSSGSGFTVSAHTSWEHDVRLAIWGYTQETGTAVGNDLTPVATWLERLWEDVRTCLLQDPTLAGLVSDLRPYGPTDTDDGMLQPYGFFAQDWRALVVVPG